MAPKRGAKRGRLSAQGDISFHATFDRAAARKVDQIHATGMIHVGEIVCASTNGISSSCMRKARARPGGPTISVCAAVPEPAAEDDEDIFPDDGGFPAGIKYVGVAKTKLDASKSPAEQRFVVQCGGLATVRLPEGAAHHYVGDLLLCGNSVKPKPGEKDGNRVTLFPDFDAEGDDHSLAQGDLRWPIVGRCLGNGGPGATMDIILSANAPGLYCLPS
jgi:hypothetical protein